MPAKNSKTKKSIRTKIHQTKPIAKKDKPAQLKVDRQSQKVKNQKSEIKNQSPDLSVIIVSLNTKDLTKQTIDSALEAMAEIEGEIIVVDNYSNDGSIEMLKKYGSKVKLIKNKRNLGFGSANNRGALEARGRYLMFLNSDTIVPKNTLAEIIKFLDQNNEVGILSPKIVNNDKDHTLQAGSFGKFSIPWRVLCRLTRKKLSLNHKLTFTKTDWVSGAAMAIRRNLFNHLRFDENIFLYFEDEDLCRRSAAYDFETVVLNNIEIVHLKGKSSTNNTRLKHYDRSQDYFIDKHFGFIWVSIIHLVRLPYRLLK